MSKTFRATLLRVEEESNPEEAVLVFEADDQQAAEEHAQQVIAGDLRNLGWRSWGDPDLWGDVQRTVVKVRELDDKGKEIEPAPGEP